MDAKTLISIVVPVYSGEHHLRDLLKEINELKAELSAANAPFQIGEIIFVDDNAIDDSPKILDGLREANDGIIVLHLGRNFGQHPATIAGILHSSGDWIVTMDEDLQHPPSAIPELLRKAVMTSSDLIYAVAEGAVHHNPFRDWTSRTIKKIISALTGNKHVASFSSFRLIRGSTARAASTVCNQDTYFDMALCWFTDHVEKVTMKLTDQRFVETGRSGYSFSALMTHARRMLFTDQLKMLRMSGFFGALWAGIAAIGAIILVLWSISTEGEALVRGWASLFLSVALFSGISIFLLSIILEYIAVLVKSVHGKPLFFAVERDGDSELIQYFSNKAPQS